MHHPETILRFARERQQQFHDEARQRELVREATSVQRPEPRERFSIRDLRWAMLRPVGA